VLDMGQCALCSNGGEGVSLLGANHKEQGWIMVCQDCWKALSEGNRIVSGSSCSGICSSCSR
jgi:hypothetical protein